jgi:hypothetical protein
VFYGYRVVPEPGDETRERATKCQLNSWREALDVLNQPAKFARRFSLLWITWQGGPFPQRRRPPDAAPEGPAAAELAIISTPHGNDEGELVRARRLIDEPERFCWKAAIATERSRAGAPAYPCPQGCVVQCDRDRWIEQLVAVCG